MQIPIIRHSEKNLNFKIVGSTTQPKNPKENTIWVDTNVEITKRCFSEAEPTFPVSGMVWIQTNAASDIRFNALTDDGLYVYPDCVYQRTSEEWEIKSAMIYANGSWTELRNGYLYKTGNEYEFVTGGWVQDSGIYVSTNVTRYNTGTVTKNDENIHMASSTNIAALITDNAINFDDKYDNLCVKCTSSGGDGANFVAIMPSKSGNIASDYSALKYLSDMGTTTTVKIPLANILSGYVAIGASGPSRVVEVLEVWLE